MISDFRLERHFKSNLKVFYSDGTSKSFAFDEPSEYSSFMDRSLDDPSVCRIESSSHTDMIFDKIPREAVI